MMQPIDEAKRKSLYAILKCATLEGLVPHPKVTGDEGQAKIALEGGSVALLIDGGVLSPVPPSPGRFKVVVADCDGQRSVEEPTELLRILQRHLGERFTEASWKRIGDEVENNCANDADCIVSRTAWNERLKQTAEEFGEKSLVETVRRLYDSAQDFQFFEQWGAIGNPYHPVSKTKIGFSRDELRSYCPEFETVVSLVSCAVRKELLAIEPSRSRVDTPNKVIGRYFPDLWTAWVESLKNEGVDPADFEFVPVHPWQADHILPTLFEAELRDRELFVFRKHTIGCRPTLSFRTLVPSQSGSVDWLPHIKLPVAVSAHNVMRGLSPHTVTTGPRVTDLLADVFQREPRIAKYLRAAPEFLGVHFKSRRGDVDQERNLSVLFRGNPRIGLPPDHMPVVLSALTCPSPVSDRPMIAELIESWKDNSPEAAVSYMQEYARALVLPHVLLYLKYGIALEAHQQNTMCVFDRTGAYVCTIVRDFDSVSIHEPTLVKAGLTFQDYHTGRVLTSDRNKVRNLMLVTTFWVHLGEHIRFLANHFRMDERPFWAGVRTAVQEVFEELSAEMGSDYESELKEIIEAPWAMASSMTENLEGRFVYKYVTIPNPLEFAH
jgi:siderophore synthetase component